MSRFSVFVRVVAPALVLSGSLAGCDRARDLFTAHAGTAAEAAGQELTAERLAQIMSSAKGVRLTRDAAELVANVWIDYSLLAQAVARGELPDDSVSVAEALWPEVAEIKGTRWHDTLMARRSAMPPTAVDSLYQKSDQRLFQHILFAARSNADDTLRTAKRKQAEATLTRLRKGAGFGRLASQLSEDPGTRSDSGYLPLGPRGRFVASFDSAAWSLEPGGTSGVVETPYGYHILRRPALEEVRERLGDHLVAQVGMRLDSLYMDSLAAANQIKLVRDAPAMMRTAIKDPSEAVESAKPLVRFTGGTLTTRDYLRWVNALPPQYSARLRTADDSALNQFATALAQNTLLLRDAEAGGIRLTPQEWTELTQRYRAQLDTLRRDMGLDVPELTDSSVPAAQRASLAADKVAAYFDRLSDGKSRLRPLPDALATLLRGRLESRLDDAGLSRSLELAKELTAARDSAQGGAQGGPPGAMRKAPGPPPIPGQPTPGPAPDSAQPQQ
jgi:parvulin-like peptidyl-prolyl isomerase